MCGQGRTSKAGAVQILFCRWASRITPYSLVLQDGQMDKTGNLRQYEPPLLSQMALACPGRSDNPSAIGARIPVDREI